MNRDEILAMKPGRELDALVAEKVMGYAIGDGQGGWIVQKVIIHRPDDGTAEWLRNGQQQLPHYSTDISAAWEVVDKLKISIVPQCLGAPDEYSYMVEYENEPYVNGIRVFASKAPEAICKAALLAVLAVIANE